MKSRYKKFVGDYKFNGLPLPENFKKGEVVFKIFEDVEVASAGSMYDLITMHWYGYPLGYHSVTYITPESLKKQIPDVKSFWMKKRGFDKTRVLSNYHEKHYQAFCRWHVNKPYTDFIRIYDPYKQKGLGGLLMEKTIEHCLEKFGCFYFSNLTSPDAELLFDSVKRKRKVFKEKEESILTSNPKTRFFIKK